MQKSYRKSYKFSKSYKISNFCLGIAKKQIVIHLLYFIDNNIGFLKIILIILKAVLSFLRIYNADLRSFYSIYLSFF